MPTYFYSFVVGGSIVKDAEGVDLPSLEEAKALATATARELLAEHIKSDSATLVESVMVADEDGEDLLTIHVRDLVPQRLR